MQYAINFEALIYDVIDGDIVIIHLESGNYYNLSDSGAVIWQYLAKTVSFDDLVKTLTSIYNEKMSRIEIDLIDFLSHLENECLIIQKSIDEAIATELILQDDGRNKVDYHSPVLDVYTDMQDFLLVDPIHEVDEQGLPRYIPQNTDDD